MNFTVTSVARCLALVSIGRFFAAAAFVALCSCPEMRAQAAGAGAVEGRVQSAGTGTYLNNARVRVAGTTREVFTNSFGEFRILDLPAGPTTLEVVFTGMAPQSVSVTVPSSGAVQKDIVLNNASQAAEGTTRADGTVVLSTFTVASQRETDATAIAINEQRFAPNRKDVVSTDAFGEINQGNVGEFVKFLPGISLDVKDGNLPSGIMVRGFDPNYTNVTMDGGQIASAVIANTQTSSRQFVLENASINNLARIEVTKLPTPDMSANLLGGSVNFVSRNAFERPRRELRISTYLSANAKALDFEKTFGPLQEDTFKILPSFDLQFVDPVSKRFGYVVTAAQSSQYYLQNRSVLGARFTSAGATLANPYTTNMNTNFAPNRTDRTSGAIKMDFKPWDRNVLSFGMQANAFRQQQASRGINYNVGGNTPVAWDEHNTIGNAVGGSVGMPTSYQSRHQLTRAINGSWNYSDVNWTAELAGGWSHSNNRVRDTAKGFFNSVSVNLPNVGRVNIFDIDHSRARFGTAQVFNTAGARVDELSLANYTLTSVNSMPMNAFDQVKEVRANVGRRFSILNNPIGLKIGGSLNDQIRDIEYTTISFNYLGPDGLVNSGDEGMGGFVDRASSGTSPGYGRPGPQWPDSFAIYDSWKNNARAWTQTPTQAGDTIRNNAVRSPWLHEKITAGYAMADGKFLRNKLRLVGGVRYELTEDEGRAVKQDNSAAFQKDAQGRPIRVNGAFVRRPEAGAASSGDEARLTHQFRASYGSRDYDYYFPSVHATYNLTDNIQLRAAFARTMGRPNISDTVPTLTISDDATFDPSAPSGFPGTIQASNSNLNPWTAKNYDYSAEYYLPRNGVVMFNWYKKDISNFFGTLDRTADAALVEELGVGSQYVGYRYRTRINIGDAMIKGWEFNLNLPLANLAPWVPMSSLAEWTKRFSVTYNQTHLGLSGSRVTATDWKRYIPRTRNIGLRFNFPKVSGNFLLNKRGRMLRDTANQFGNDPVTNQPRAAEYIRGRYQLDGNIEYQMTKRFSVFLAARNLLNAPSQWEVAGPIAPDWSFLTNNEDYGAQYSFGVKATF